MHSYKYTLNVTSWSLDEENLLSSAISKNNISYTFDKSFLASNKVILIVKGLKKNLDNLEIKLAKQFSQIKDIEYFTKTTTKLSLNQDDIYLEDYNFSLLYKGKYRENPLQEAVKLIKSQKIALIKNTNGYYLVAISTKSSVVKKIRDILSTEETLPILIKNTQQAKFAIIDK